MKSSNKKYLGVVISTIGLFGLTACNSGGSASPNSANAAAPTVSTQSTPTTPSCLKMYLNSTTPSSKTKNNLQLAIQNDCSEPLDLNNKSLAFLSQDVTRSPIDAPLKFNGSGNGKKYTLAFNPVDPQTGLAQSIATTKFTLAPQEGVILKGNGTLSGTAYDWKTANATLQVIDSAHPVADACFKAHIMVGNPDAKKRNTATVYVENTCDSPQALKGKELSFLSQDMAGYPVMITQLQGTANNNVNYSIPFNNTGINYLYGKFAPNTLVLEPHWGIQLTASFPLHGSKYDFFTAERTLLIRDIPATPSACLSGHVFVDPDATTMNTEIQVAVQNNCSTTQPVYGKDISFVAQDINNNPIWVSTLMVNTEGFAAASGIYTMNFDTQPDAQNRMHRFITPVKDAPELLLPAHQTLTFTGTAPLMGYAFDLQTAEQSFSVTN